jgi:hypothetical protein
MFHYLRKGRYEVVVGTAFALKVRRRVKRVPRGMVATSPRTGETTRGGQFLPKGATPAVGGTGDVVPAGE